MGIDTVYNIGPVSDHDLEDLLLKLVVGKIFQTEIAIPFFVAGKPTNRAILNFRISGNFRPVIDNLTRNF